MKRLLFSALVALSSVVGASAQTATLTASTANYSATGGTVTFTAGIDYSTVAVPTALGFKINLPAGWSLAAREDTTAFIGGTNVPNTTPPAGTTTSLDFAYSSFPANRVSFVVVVAYPAGISGTQTITASAIYRTPETSLTLPPLSFTSAPDAAPAVTAHPVSQVANAGQSVTFTAAASGNPSPIFQWRKNTFDIPNANGPAYTIPNAVSGSAGSYDVVVTNPATGASATSNAAILTVRFISSLSPTSDGQGATVTITGSGFTGATAVRFNGIDAASFTIVSNTQITAVVPTFATTGPISVTLADASVLTSTGTFTVQEGPRLVNMSQRSASTGGESAVMQSFSIQGTTAKPVLIRAVGPALGAFGISGFMVDPFLSIYDGSGTQIASNNDWDASLASTFAAVGAFNFPAGSKDAAILTTLQPGTYTARVTGVGGTTGIVLIETYETDATKRIPYMSNRSQVGTGGDAKVTGFVLGGAGTTGNKTVLIRAVGAGLGVPGSLLNPTLTVFSGSTAIATNDNWGSSTNVSEINTATVTVGAMPLGTNDSALLLSLPAGSYTAQVSGVGNTTGVALTEVFLVDSFLPTTLPPALLAPLHAQAIDVNATLTLAAPFIGKPAPAFQWQKDSVDLVSQTAFTLSVPSFTGANVGDYRVVLNPAAGVGAVTSAVAAVTINKASPNLVWNSPAAITYGTALVAPPVSGAQLNATAAVPGTFVYTPAAGTVLNAGAGQLLSVTFTPTDTASYNTVTTSVSITVNKATPTVTWSAPSAITYGAALSATQLNAQSAVAGTFAYAPAAGTVLNAGANQTLSVTFTPTDSTNYNNATRSTTITVNKATPVVTWNAPTDIVYGTTLSATQLNATANVAGTFAYTPAAGSVLNAGANQTLSVTFTPTDAANYTTATGSTTITVNKATPTVSWAVPAPISFGTALSVAQLNATASVAGTFAYTPAAGTLLPVGTNQTLAVAFTPTDSANYNSASGGTSITVNKATPVIAWPTPSAITFGAALSNVQLNAVASVPGTFVYTPAAGTVLNAGANQALSVTFTPTDTASYNSATGGTTITVNKATPVITWSTPASIVYGTALSATQLNATANVAGTFVYNPAAGTLLEPAASPQTLGVAFTPTDTVNYANATGSTTIQVNKAVATVTLTNLSHTYNGFVKGAGADTVPAGLNLSFAYTGTTSSTTAPTNVGSYGVTATIVDNRYQGSATGTITINKADQTINFAALPSKPLDSGNFALTATASSGLGVSYATSNPSTGTVATVSGSTVTLVNTGTITITASQAGDSNYNAATAVSQVLTVLNQSQAVTFDQTQLPAKTFGNTPFTISATSNRGLLVNFVSSNTSVATVGTGTLAGNVTSATVTIIGAGTADITAKQAGDANTAAAPDILRTLTVAKAAATVVLGGLSATYDGTPKAATATTTPVGLNVAFTYTGTASASTPPTNAGTYGVTGTITGATPPESNYSGSATSSIVIAKATQTITFPTVVSPKLINNGAFTLGATASSALAVSYTSSNTSVATVSGDTVTIVGLGSTTLTAKQAGDANFLAAADATQTLVVNPVAPVIQSTPPLAQTLVIGDSFSFGAVTLNALSSPATFTLTGTLPTGLTASSVNATTGAISGIITGTSGTYNLVLTVTNATGTDSRTIVLTVNPPAPVFTSPASVTGTVATGGFSYTAVATNAASYALTGALPPGLAIAGGVISGTPTQAGTYPVTITATNVTGSASLSLVIRIVANPNSPVITSSALVNGQVGAALNYQLTSVFTGSSAAPTSYGFSGALPSGVTLNSTTGLVSGTPLAGSAGSYPVFFAASNSNGAGLPLQVTFVIAPAANVPVITSNGTAAGQIGQAFVYNIAASNGPITGYAATGLPAGLGINTTTGAITGTPTAETIVGTPASVTLTATNATGTSNPKTLLITITSAPGTPVITSGLMANLRVGIAFSYTITAAPTPTSYSAIGLPPGLGLSGGVISGTPTQSDVFAVTLRAGNAAGVGPASTLSLNVLPPLTAPTISSPAGASGTVGTAFTYNIVAAPGPIAVYAVNGTLPLGLSLNALTGAITGTPSVSGLSTVEITATSAGGTSLPQELVINIAPAVGVPSITSGGTATGRVGQNFTYTITATNVGVAPYAPSVVLEAINLPAGLAANPSTGLIQGVPTTVGTTIASLVGTNAVGTGPSRTLSITIEPAATAPVIFGATLVSAQAGVPFAYTISALPAATSFEVLGAPPWLTLNSTSGALGGTPTLPGQVQVQLVASNSAGASLPVTLSINVAAAANTPVITSTRTADGTVGALFAGYTVTASNGPIASYLAIGLPPGLTLNPATGAITGTPTSSGTYPVFISATNVNGVGAAVAVTFTIARSVTFGL